MKKVLSVLMASLLFLTATGCGNEKDTAEKSNGEALAIEDVDEIVIGGLAPLTGDVSQYGIAANNGVLLAVEEINGNGGIKGKKIKHIVEDEQGEPTEAINAYNKLYQSDEIIALVGDVTTKPSIAVAQQAAKDGIPMITPTGTGEDITLAGDNIFRACFIDPYQGELMAHYTKEKLGAETVAVLYDTGDDYSDGVAEAFKAAAEELELEMVNYEGYASGVDDFNAQLTKIKTSNPDVILVPTYYDDASKIISQARKMEIDATIIGCDGWDGVEQKIDKDNLDLLDDTFYCSQYSRQSDKKELQDFMKKYEEEYGMQENMFAVLGYDAMMMLAKAIEEADSLVSEDIVKALEGLSFEGLTGETTFDENRNPVREAYITTFENGESKVKEVYSFK